jgi:hypothetical protein
MSAIPYISNRFAMKRFLGMTDEELAENERLWREENIENLEVPPADAAGEMRSAGISGAGLEADVAGAELEGAPEGDAVEGGVGTPPETNTGTELGADAAATDQTI